MSTDTPTSTQDISGMLDRFDGLTARAAEIADQARSAAIRLVGDVPLQSNLTATAEPPGSPAVAEPSLLGRLDEKLNTLHTRLETISESIRPINEVTGT